VDPFDRDRLSDGECVAVFGRLFPLGFAGDDVVGEIAPQGWERSPLLAVFHPSVEQVYREALRVHRNLERLPGRTHPPQPEPTLDEIRQSWRDEPWIVSAKCAIWSAAVCGIRGRQLRGPGTSPRARLRKARLSGL
jgi:hypothetical protein